MTKEKPLSDLSLREIGIVGIARQMFKEEEAERVKKLKEEFTVKPRSILTEIGMKEIHRRIDKIFGELCPKCEEKENVLKYKSWEDESSEATS